MQIHMPPLTCKDVVDEHILRLASIHSEVREVIMMLTTEQKHELHLDTAFHMAKMEKLLSQGLYVLTRVRDD